jgi:hypothetical protein
MTEEEAVSTNFGEFFSARVKIPGIQIGRKFAIWAIFLALGNFFSRKMARKFNLGEKKAPNFCPKRTFLTFFFNP